MIARDVIYTIHQLAPPYLAEKWDNSGLQLGSREKEVSRILIALDVSQGVVNEAINRDIDMIISHHPMIFSGLKNISKDETKGQMIYNLIKKDIAVFAAHTNLDICNEGPNDYLGQLLGLKELDVLNVTHDAPRLGNGRIGVVDKPMTLGEYSKLVKEKLSCSSIRVYGDLKEEIHRVAICGGSGGDFIIDAYQKNAQLYITGDIKYHDSQLALELGISLIDAGHFDTEKHILKLLKDYLEDTVSDDVCIWIYEGNDYAFEVL